MAAFTVSRVASLLRKAGGQARLVWTNPEEALRNVRQFTHPDQFLARLLDMPHIVPLRATVRGDAPPTLNVLLPVVAPQAMTGGPNTILNIAYRLAARGLAVRFIACGQPIAGDTAWFWRHAAALTGVATRPAHVSLVDGCRDELAIGADDVFLAGFWTTAHQAAALLPQTRRKTFLYLIQDFEPGFYPWSSHYAMALDSYNLPFQAIINEGFLAEYLFANRVGQFADSAFRRHCAVFEPAIDRAVFHPGTARPAPRRRRLLMYARPTNPRNLLGMAVAALRRAVADPAFAGDWEYLAIGARGSMPAVPLGPGRVLREAPWLGYGGYGEMLRSADILLCPMLSPHTSYPVLEMAACGGWSVTNTFASKTAAGLHAMASTIIAVEATVDGFAAGLIKAATQGDPGDAALTLPFSWDEALVAVTALVNAAMALP